MSDLQRYAEALRALDIPLLAEVAVVSDDGIERLWMTSSAGVVVKTDASDHIAEWEAADKSPEVLARSAQKLRDAFEARLTRSGRARGRLFPILRNADYVAQARADLGIDPVALGMMQPFSKTLFLAYAYDFPDRIEGLFTPDDLPLDLAPEGLENHAIDKFATQVAFSGQIGVEPALETGFWRLRFDGSFDASRMLLLYDWDGVAEKLFCDVSDLFAVPIVNDVLLFGVLGPQGFKTLAEAQRAATALAARIVEGGGTVLSAELFMLDDNEVVQVQ